MPISKQKV